MGIIRSRPFCASRPGESIRKVNTVQASSGPNIRDLDRFTCRRLDIARLDFGKINPVAGPIFVEGAAPGDVLKATLLSFTPSGWGWTANIPGFGLLAGEFRDPAIHIWKYDSATPAPALFGRWAAVPLKSYFTGTIEVAPAAPGHTAHRPPRRVGGKYGCARHLAGHRIVSARRSRGTLFSVSDAHAAQGDGEVCGTAIESPMKVAIKFDLIKSTPLALHPRFTTPGPVCRHLDAKGYEVTTGIGPDLMEASRSAVRSMIDLLCRQQGMPAVDAYLLCSVCGDLRISEIVDAPNWTVSFYFPRIVFD